MTSTSSTHGTLQEKQDTSVSARVRAADSVADSAAAGVTQVSVLLYSDDITTRDAVRAAAGRRPARDVEIIRWHECATGPAVTEALDAGGFDLAILDGEAAPTGGLGLCRELKNEIYDCPPILVLTGRPQDGWLAGWSHADGALSHPLDPLQVAEVIAQMARTVVGVRAVGPVSDHSATAH